MAAVISTVVNVLAAPLIVVPGNAVVMAPVPLVRLGLKPVLAAIAPAVAMASVISVVANVRVVPPIAPPGSVVVMAPAMVAPPIGMKTVVPVH